MQQSLGGLGSLMDQLRKNQEEREKFVKGACIDIKNYATPLVEKVATLKLTLIKLAAGSIAPEEKITKIRDLLLQSQLDCEKEQTSKQQFIDTFVLKFGLGEGTEGTDVNAAVKSMLDDIDVQIYKTSTFRIKIGDIIRNKELSTENKVEEIKNALI